MRAFELYNRLVLGSIVVLVGRVAWCRWYVPSGYAVTSAEGPIFGMHGVRCGNQHLRSASVGSLYRTKEFALKAGEGRKGAFVLFILCS